MFTQTIDMFDLYKWKETKLSLNFWKYLCLKWQIIFLNVTQFDDLHYCDLSLAFRYSKLNLNTALFNKLIPKFRNKNAER